MIQHVSTSVCARAGIFHFRFCVDVDAMVKKKWSGILFLIVLIVLGDVGSLIAAQIQ